MTLKSSTDYLIKFNLILGKLSQIIRNTSIMQLKNKSERMKKMTGEQFLNKVRQIKEITDIHWSIEGDVLIKEVKVVVIADDEEIELYYPKPGEDDYKG